MNTTAIQALLAGVMSLAQLIIGGLLLFLAHGDAEMRGLGIGLLTGGLATGTAAGMRTRAGKASLLLLVGFLAVTTTACGSAGSAALKASYSGLHMTAITLSAYDLAKHETTFAPVRAACGCDSAWPPKNCTMTETIECRESWETAQVTIRAYYLARAPALQAIATAAALERAATKDKGLDPVAIGKAVEEAIRLVNLLTGKVKP